ncbi:MAG: hypothetical protein JXA67_15180 [Micromonosporaceae bacterium]|nr:hypothetical protein [Micromonosporaceae bacterium]
MPAPRHRWTTRHRRQANYSLIITCAAALAALATASGVSGGQASAEVPASACYAPFVASAAADLVVLRNTDLTPLGDTSDQTRQLATPAALLGSSRAGIYAGRQPQAAARAGLLAPGRYIYQTAPPSGPSPVTRTINPIVTATTQTGPQRMQAAATLSDAATCDETTGPVSAASLDLEAGATVGGAAGPVLRLPRGSETTTAAGLASDAGSYSVVATSTTTVGDLRLFEHVTIRQSGHLLLRSTATGTAETSGITYRPPGLSVAIDHGEFYPVTEHVDLIAPTGPVSVAAASKLAKGSATPLMPLSAFRQTMAVLGVSAATVADGAVAVVRVTAGAVAQQNLGWRVHAVATTARIQVLIRDLRPAGLGPETRIAEFAVGTAETLAIAPVGGYSRTLDLGLTAATGPAIANQSLQKQASRAAVPADRFVDVMPPDQPIPEAALLDPGLSQSTGPTKGAAATSAGPRDTAGGGHGAGDSAASVGAQVPDRVGRPVLVTFVCLGLMLFLRLVGLIRHRARRGKAPAQRSPTTAP